jgi:hypothetical protein
MTQTWGLTKQELRILKQLNTPRKIQDFLDTKLAYNYEEKRETCRSPRVVLRERSAHCMEGALLAAAAMRVNGMEPLIVDLAAKRDHDHIIAVFKQHGRWGAISKSRFLTLQYRDPVYRTLRELAMSYFAFYNNMQGSKTLRSYSQPINLKRYDHLDWMTSEEDLWDIGNSLFDLPHTELVTAEMTKTLRPLSKAFMKADANGS